MYMILWKPQKDISIPISYIFHAPLHIKKIPINNPVDELQFLIPNSMFGMYAISRLLLLFNKTWSTSSMSCLLESSNSKMFPVGLGS